MSGNSLTITETGLQTIDTALQAVSDNLANAGTIGFKAESAEFGTLLGSLVGNNALGGGAEITGLYRDFSQGAIVQSNSPTDLAIQGNGFFIFQDSAGIQAYSRDGQLSIGPNGTLVGSTGDPLLGFALNSAGAASGVLAPLTIPQTVAAPTASAKVALSGNLDAADPALTGAINPSNASSYSASVSVQVFDSLGQSHVLTFYFQNAGPTAGTPPNEQWNWLATLDGSTTGLSNNTGTVEFNSAGAVVSGGTPAAALTATVSGAAPLSLALNLGSLTQYAATSAATGTADGNPVGTPEGVQVNSTGVISVSYSNGETSNVGQVALATFPSLEGLSLTASGLLQATSASGAPTISAPGAGSAGVIRPSALESSNVDSTSQLVNLIALQRSFQANAQALQTAANMEADIVQLQIQP